MRVMRVLLMGNQALSSTLMRVVRVFRVKVEPEKIRLSRISRKQPGNT
jgi:hypothetical protein